MDYVLTTQRFHSLQEAGRRWARAWAWIVVVSTSIVEAYRLQREADLARAELASMSERDLRDIGISRSDIDYLSVRAAAVARARALGG
jgi:uncharacterized protein YjiS (DUF1127 family)